MIFRNPPAATPNAAAEEDRKPTALDAILERYSAEALYRRSLDQHSWTSRTIATQDAAWSSHARFMPVTFLDPTLNAARSFSTYLGGFPAAPPSVYDMPTRAYTPMHPNVAFTEWPYTTSIGAMRDLISFENADQILERFGFETIWPAANPAYWTPVPVPADNSRIEIRAAELERRLRRHPDLVARLTDAHEALISRSWLVPANWPGLLEWANSNRDLVIEKLEARLQRWIDDEVVSIARDLHAHLRTPASKYAVEVAVAHQQNPRVALPAWILATEVLVRDATNDPSYEIFARTKRSLAGDRLAHLISALGLRRRKPDLDAAVSILDRASRSTFELDPSFASRHAIAHPKSLEPVTDANARRWALLFMHFGELAVARLAA